MKLHEILHFHRKKKKFTLISLSEKAEIPYGILYRLETGKIKKPHPDLLRKISIPLELDYIELLTKSGYCLDSEQKPNPAAVFSIPIFNLSKTKKSKQTHLQIKSDNNDENSCFLIDNNDFFPIIQSGDLIITNQSSHRVLNRIYLCELEDRSFALGLCKQRGNDHILYDFSGVLLEDRVRSFSEIKHIHSK